MKEFKTKKALTAFLYLLMRDHIPAGTVELIMEDLTRGAGFTLSNGFLGEYAEELTKLIEEKDAVEP